MYLYCFPAYIYDVTCLSEKRLCGVQAELLDTKQQVMKTQEDSF